MRLTIILVIAVLYLPSSSFQTPAVGDRKLDPYLVVDIAAKKLTAREMELLPILVVVREDNLDSATQTLWQYGEIVGVYGHVVSMRATPLAIERLSRLERVERIEMSMPFSPLLDQSVPAIGAPLVWNTVQDVAGRHVDGTGQIVGIVDTGIDYTHPDFWFPNGTTKILYIWYQLGTGTPPSGFRYGIECARAQIQDRSCPVTDEAGHGTHVAGIAASSGLAEGNRPGVAPGASFIIVKSGRYFTRCGDQVWSFPGSQWVDGVAYIVQRAKQLKKQPIVNLSLGSTLGPHDGTSAAERAVDAFVSQGAVIAVSAGNYGRRMMHASGNLTQGSSVTLKLKIPPGEEAVQVDLWYSTSDLLDISAISPSGNKVVNGPTPDVGKATTEGNVTIIQGSGQLGNEWFVRIQAPQGQTPKGWTVTLKATQISGRGSWDAWTDGDCTSPEFDDGRGYVADNLKTVGSPATAHNVITVGAFVTKTSWVGLDGAVYQTREGEGDQTLASFSSRGPTRDGRMKPDITAPGAVIASARSSQIKPYGSDAGPFHRVLQGTSMAAPHVAGLAALMLQRDPSLTPVRIKEILRVTSRLDRWTGSFERSQGSFAWGAGKIDALGAVKQRMILKIQLAGLPEDARADLTVGGTPSGQIDSSGRTVEVDPLLLPPIGISQIVAGAPGTRYFAKENTWIPRDASAHEFKYTKQYELVLNSMYGFPIGAGWYDAGSSAKISIPKVVPAPGVLGLLGVKFIFIEWTGPPTQIILTQIISTHQVISSQLISTHLNSSEATIEMTGPIELKATWRGDYTPLIALVLVVAMVLGLWVFYKLRFGKSRKPSHHTIEENYV